MPKYSVKSRSLAVCIGRVRITVAKDHAGVVAMVQVGK
jgi:hypothetical protein